MIISFFVGVVFFLFAFFVRKDINVRGRELVDEMTNIEKEFITPVGISKEYDV